MSCTGGSCLPSHFRSQFAILQLSFLASLQLKKTSVLYNNASRAANLSRQLSNYLIENWSDNFDVTLDELQRAVISLNSTRVDPSLATGFVSWFSSAFSYFKKWVGVGTFMALCVGGGILCLWLSCKMRAQVHRDKVILTQALTALELGASPQVWLAALRQE